MAREGGCGLLLFFLPGNRRRTPLRKAVSLALAALAAIAAAAFLGACRPRVELECRDCDAVLISIDTLRADHLGCYGYARETSPNLDRLARQSILFEHASSVSYHTAESHMAVFTSLYPSVHGVQNASSAEQAIPLPSTIPTFVEILRSHGFHTVGFHAGGNVSPTYGFGRGFESYRWTDSDVSPAVGWVESQAQAVKGRFFLFYHTYRPHDPYLPNPPFDSMWEKDYRGAVLGNAVEFARRLSRPDDFAERRDLFWKNVRRDRPEDVRKVVALYDGEIRQVDQEVGRLLDAIGRLDRKVVVYLMSDHGEEFLEHGHFLHDQAYEELLHVPFMIHLPGAENGVRVAQPVSLLDLAPTLLEMLGIDVPTGIQGRSLVPTLASGRTAPGHPIYAEKVATVDRETGAPTSLKQALTRGELKVILLPDGKRELYDLALDPGEHKNLIGTESEPAKALFQAVERLTNANGLLRRVYWRGMKTSATSVDEETLQQLRALGYLR